MSDREQFLNWGRCDHTAVCMTCAHNHLIPKGEQVGPQPWIDWLAKHPGHITFVVPTSELTKLGDLVAKFKHNADVKLEYAASGTLTCVLTGLASDTNLLTGRESTAISNATNKYGDILLAAKVTTGTTPTTGRVIEEWVYASLDDTPTYPDVFDGTDSAETISAAEVKPAALKIFDVVPTNGTSNVTYPTGPRGIAQLFGGIALPKNWGVFVTHSTAVNLNATASNHAIYYTPVYQTVI